MRIVFLFVAVLVMAACASTGPYQIDLMPAPDVYEEGVIDPFTDPSLIKDCSPSVLYATTRLPADKDAKESYYRNERGTVLRLGVAQIRLGQAGVTWEEARRISLLKNRTDKYPLFVSTVEEFGVLDRSATVFTDPALLPEEPHAPAARFAAAVNDKLKRSKQKDVYIYVHGYKVNFESPVLVSTELWHFLGYEGVFIAYSWPATPSRLAYFGDLETAVGSTRNFRDFLQYLANETDVRRIHIVGYSAGTRLVASALDELALINQCEERESIEKRLPIGQVVLVASDVDRQIFGVYLTDGLLNVVDRVSIYVSEKDSALGLSRFLFARERLGQMWQPGTLTPMVEDYLRKTDRLNIINVTEAEGSTSGNGHSYFRSSPWASSDVLVTLRYNLSPAERGLVRKGGSPIWHFPPDYIRQLRATLQRVNPDLVPAPQQSSAGGTEPTSR